MPANWTNTNLTVSAANDGTADIVAVAIFSDGNGATATRTLRAVNLNNDHIDRILVKGAIRDLNLRDDSLAAITHAGGPWQPLPDDPEGAAKTEALAARGTLLMRARELRDVKDLVSSGVLAADSLIVLDTKKSVQDAVAALASDAVAVKG